jgi:hypothetical protein
LKEWLRPGGRWLKKKRTGTALTDRVGCSRFPSARVSGPLCLLGETKSAPYAAEQPELPGSGRRLPIPSTRWRNAGTLLVSPFERCPTRVILVQRGTPARVPRLPGLLAHPLYPPLHGLGALCHRRSWITTVRSASVCRKLYPP